VYVDALVLRDRDTDSDGVPDDERLWVQQDANWNVTALVDDYGNVVERFVYDPFGAATVYDASYTTAGASAYDWVYMRQGLRWDATAGLYDNRYRWYSPTLGRFTSMDPLQYLARDVNLFRYVANTPTVLTDPSGLQPPIREVQEIRQIQLMRELGYNRRCDLQYYIEYYSRHGDVHQDVLRRARDANAAEQAAHRAAQAAAAAAAAAGRRTVAIRIFRVGTAGILLTGMILLSDRDPRPPGIPENAILVGRQGTAGGMLYEYRVPGGESIFVEVTPESR